MYIFKRCFNRFIVSRDLNNTRQRQREREEQNFSFLFFILHKFTTRKKILHAYKGKHKQDQDLPLKIFFPFSFYFLLHFECRRRNFFSFSFFFKNYETTSPPKEKRGNRNHVLMLEYYCERLIKLFDKFFQNPLGRGSQFTAFNQFFQ